MRVVILILALLVAAFVIGWLRFDRNGDSATIEIDGAKIRNDSSDVLEEGRDLLDRGRQQIEQEPSEPAVQ